MFISDFLVPPHTTRLIIQWGASFTTFFLLFHISCYFNFLTLPSRCLPRSEMIWIFYTSANKRWRISSRKFSSKKGIMFASKMRCLILRYALLIKTRKNERSTENWNGEKESKDHLWFCWKMRCWKQWLLWNYSWVNLCLVLSLYDLQCFIMKFIKL